MGRAGLLLLMLALGGCVRVVAQAQPDAGTTAPPPPQVEITNLELENQRPGSTSTTLDGGPLLEVYAGEILVISGRNWSAAEVTVTVGGVSLALLEGSTNTMLRVLVPANMPNGPVRVETTVSRRDSAHQVVVLGPGHLVNLAERGLIQGQAVVTASGALQGCDLAYPTMWDDTGAALNAQCSPYNSAAAGMAVAFVPGLRANGQDAMYWRGLSVTGLDNNVKDWFGRVPVPAALEDVPVTGQYLVDLRSYVDVLDGGVEAGPVQAQLPAALQVVFARDTAAIQRVVTPFAATPPLPDAVGPLFATLVDNAMLQGLPSRGVRLFTLRAYADSNRTPALAVDVVEHLAQPDGTLGAQALGGSPGGGPLEQRVAAAGMFDLNQLAVELLGPTVPPGPVPPSLPGFVLLTCGPAPAEFNPTLELHPYALVDITGQDGPAWTPLPPITNITGSCAQTLCPFIPPLPDMDAGVTALPPTLPRLVPWQVGTLVVEPTKDTSVFGLTEGLPCVILTRPVAPDAGFVEEDAGMFGGTGNGDPAGAQCDAGPCPTADLLYNLSGSAVAISRNFANQAQQLHALRNHRVLATVDSVSAETTFAAPTELVTAAPYGTVLTDPLTGFLLGVPQWGSAVDVLYPGSGSASPFLRIPLAGDVLGAWPLHGSQGAILVAHQHLAMVLDVGGNPTVVLPQPGTPFDGFARMEDGTGANQHVVAALFEGTPALFLWRTDQASLGAPVLREDPVYRALRPVAARDGRVLYWRDKGIKDMPIGGLGGPGEVPPEVLAQSCRVDLAVVDLEGTRVPQPVAESCRSEPVGVFLDQQGRIWIPDVDSEVGTAQLRVVNPDRSSHVLRGVEAVSFTQLPSGALLATVVMEGPPQQLALGCLTSDGTTVSLRDVGPPPTLDGPILVSPDGRRIFAGTVNSLLELEVPPLDATGCPPPSTTEVPVPIPVTRRITLPGSPSLLSMNRAGDRLIWVDETAQLVGLAE